METLKSAVGLGKKEEAGEEPVSGEKGEGTTVEPYDAGNSEKAQETAKSQLEEQDSEQKDNTSGGTWLKASLPFLSGKKEDKASEPDTSAGAELPSSTAQPVQDDASRPPNHLGVNVPSGHSLDFAEPQPPEQSSSEPKAMSDSEASKTAVNPSTNGTDAGPSSPSTTERSGSTSAAGVPYSKLRGSRASIAEPSGKRVFNPAGQNPGRIPIAGGVPVGARASDDRRRRSLWSSQGSAEMPPLDKQGSPDAVTQHNTVANTVPQTSNGEGSSKMAQQPPAVTPEAPVAPTETAQKKEGKPNFGAFEWGEGGEGAAMAKEKETNGATTSNAAPVQAANGTSSVGTTDKAKEMVKENTPASKSSSPTTEKKEKKGFARLKEKLGGSKK